MYQAIDIHGHFGAPDCFPQRGLEKEFLKLSLEALKAEYERQNVKAACLSPMEAIFPNGEQALLNANSYMAELASTHSWLYQWVVVNPLMPASFLQAEQMLRHPKCVGVKIHPDGNRYPLEDYAGEVFAFCSENHAVLETHSGDALSLPEALVPFADQYKDVKVIAAHLGCGYDGCLEHQVRAIQGAKHGNIYTDVSSVKSILNSVVEWAVQQVTSKKLLFGTDTPLHHIAMMKSRIDFANLDESQKADILYRNAETLFLEGTFI